MRIISLLMGLAISLSGASAFAGASNTTLKCANTDGSVQLNGHVPGDFSEFNLTAKFKNEQGTEEVLRLFSYVDQETSLLVENGRVAAVEDLSNGVFTVRAEGINEKSFGIIVLYALPKSVKSQRKDGSITSSFKANLSIYGKTGAEDTTVSCTTKYM